MKIRHQILKIFLCIVAVNIYSFTYANTTTKGMEIFNQLKEDGRTNSEIRLAMSDLGYDANEYLGESDDSGKSNNTNNSDSIIDYDKILENLENGDYQTTYTARNCKEYKIEYIEDLDVFTSSDLKNKEYFINIEYLKRYIDSKNPEKPNCPTNEGRISTSYRDTSSDSKRYTAPNGKVYFISEQNGRYSSKQITNQKDFSSLSEIKFYIRDRNPLIGMNLK